MSAAARICIRRRASIRSTRRAPIVSVPAPSVAQSAGACPAKRGRQRSQQRAIVVIARHERVRSDGRPAVRLRPLACGRRSRVRRCAEQARDRREWAAPAPRAAPAAPARVARRASCNSCQLCSIAAYGRPQAPSRPRSAAPPRRDFPRPSSMTPSMCKASCVSGAIAMTARYSRAPFVDPSRHLHARAPAPFVAPKRSRVGFVEMRPLDARRTIGRRAAKARRPAPASAAPSAPWHSL